MVKCLALLGLPDMDVGEVNPISSWNVDPNEPRYCLCNDVSYGEMVGCDNEDVSTLFFRVISFCFYT